MRFESTYTGAAPVGTRVEAMPSGLSLDSMVVDGRDWDRLAAGFDGICQEQLTLFAEARWPAMTVEAMVFKRGTRVVGGAVTMLRRLPLGLGGLAITKWGPILADADSPTASEDYARMVDGLMENYARRRGMMLTVMPRMSPIAVNPAVATLRAKGFRPGVGITHPARYFVRIEKNEAVQRAAYAQKWRYHLNKAEKEGLVFERYPASALPTFQKLYDSMLDRKQFPDYSAVHTLPAMMSTPIDGVRPELFLVSHLGQPVAGAIIFTAGEIAVYLYGATNDKALPLNAGFFMHHHIISWLRDHSGAKWYDLGGTDGYEGLHRFKSGMTGKTGAITDTPPAFNYATSPLPWLVGTSAHRLRDLLARWRQARQRQQTGA